MPIFLSEFMIKKCLTIILAMIFGVSLLFNPHLLNVEIDSFNGYYYEAIINGEKIFIHLLEGDMDENINEEEVDKEVEEKHIPKPGKIKIAFKDSPKYGTTLVYERDMEDGEISETDQIYIEQILSSIKDFHRENKTLTDKMKETINNLFMNIRKKR